MEGFKWPEYHYTNFLYNAGQQNRSHLYSEDFDYHSGV